MSRRAWAYLALIAVTLAVYAAMVLWSLPKIVYAAGGLLPFDLRPTGYSLSEAQAFLAALDGDAVGFYLDVQQRLDLFYPALMALVLVGAFMRLFGWLPAAILSGIAVLGALFDYLENAAVRAMLTAGPDAMNETLVHGASRWTMLKSGFAGVAILALLVGLAMAGWRRWRAHK